LVLIFLALFPKNNALKTAKRGAAAVVLSRKANFKNGKGGPARLAMAVVAGVVELNSERKTKPSRNYDHHRILKMLDGIETQPYDVLSTQRL
jgi:hypothetical protein